MVQGTFIMTALSRRGPEEVRKVNYRQTNMRYLVIVIAIFVVFGCEYCFDNPSVPISIG